MEADSAAKSVEKDKKSRSVERKKEKPPNNLTLASGCTPMLTSGDLAIPSPVKSSLVPQVEPLTPPNSVLKKRTSSDAGFDDFIHQMPPPPLPPSRSSGNSSDFTLMPFSLSAGPSPGPKFVSCLATTDSSPTDLSKLQQSVSSNSVSVTPQFVSCLAAMDDLTEDGPSIQIPTPMNAFASNLAAISPSLRQVHHSPSFLSQAPNRQTASETPNPIVNGIEK